MRFMIIRKADPATEAGQLPGEDLVAAMARYNESLLKAGVLLDRVALGPSAHGARLRFAGGRPTVTDGPFAEARELIAGFTMIDVPSREEAIEWARRWPALDGNGAVELELRSCYELSDFARGTAG